MMPGYVKKVMQELNTKIPADGVSKATNPQTLILGKPPPDYNEIVKLDYGKYVKVRNVRNTTNTNQAGTTGTIALYPTDNQGKSWHFMSLDIGKRIHRYQWTKIPLSTGAIQRVNEIAKKEGQSIVREADLYDDEHNLPPNEEPNPI